MEHLSRAPLRQAPGLTHKHSTRLAILARDKHSCLLQKFVIYGRKKSYDIDTSGQCYKCYTLQGRLLTLPSSLIHQTRLERLTRDKHSSFLRNSVTYGRKTFYDIDTRTKINPSRVWRRCDPSSFKISGFLVNAGFIPHPSPSPETEQNDIEVVCQIKNMFANIKKISAWSYAQIKNMFASL